MKKNMFDEPLFIFEMANNHMGSVDHGLAMIEAFADVSRKFPFRFAFKFQLRDLDTFIHPGLPGAYGFEICQTLSRNAVVPGDNSSG